MQRQSTNEATRPTDSGAIVSDARIEAAGRNLEVAGQSLERVEQNLEIAKRRLRAAVQDVMEARVASPGPFASPELKAAMHERTQAVHALHDAEAAISIAQIRRMDGRLALKRAEQGIPDPPAAVVIGGPGVINGKPADWEKPGHKPTELGRFTLVEAPIEVDPMVRAEVAPGDFRRLTESVARRLGLL